METGVREWLELWREMLKENKSFKCRSLVLKRRVKFREVKQSKKLSIRKKDVGQFALVIKINMEEKI